MIWASACGVAAFTAVTAFALSRRRSSSSASAGSETQPIEVGPWRPGLLGDVWRVLRSRLKAEYRSQQTAATASAERRYWGNIQLLRLIAAYGIVYVHLEPAFAAIPAGKGLIDMLRFGTDLFLVVAGFLTAQILGRCGKSGLAYLRDRAIRILPLYFLFTVLAFLVKNYATGAEPHTMRELLMSLAFVPYGPYPILHPTWTLVVIVEFSVITAAFQLANVRHGVYLAAAFVAALTLMGGQFHPTNRVLSAYTDPILMDFVFGVLIYKFVTSRAATALPKPTLLLTAVAIIAICTGAVILRPYLWPSVPRLLALGVPTSGILLGAVILEQVGLAVNLELVNLLAKCTYSIYLCHQFVNGVSEEILSYHQGTIYVPMAILAATPFMVTCIAAVIFVCIEAPTTRYLSRVLRS
ncbi:exopolysaccharide production protein ExoZ [Mesorhizobium soli]|uniref:acyltransferase family protein n=1 Tax=Pseudaminobacter soli (ex Li et al. 2025) TaxID=1295366 RepID=UPI002474F0A5|nr:acyltransferase [Mesorhizobium soli]MDH6229805.1 exopolysaccharide production protein ExoZ [Mesorhizobium soli]